jgi:hypothetical protein
VAAEGVLLLLLVGEVLGVLEFEAGFLLGVDHEVVGEFVVEAAHVKGGDVVFGGLGVELIEGTLLAGDGLLVGGLAVLGEEGVLGGVLGKEGVLGSGVLGSVLGEDGVLGVAVVFEFGGLAQLGGDLFIDDRVYVIRLLDWLHRPSLLLVEVD